MYIVTRQAIKAAVDTELSKEEETIRYEIMKNKSEWNQEEGKG